MTEVKLLIAISGARGAFNVGDTYPCSADEAKRFIAAGMGEAIRQAPAEKAVKRTNATEKAVKR